MAFIGTGLPMIAAYLATFTHAPRLTLIFESGIIGAQPRRLVITVFEPVSKRMQLESVHPGVTVEEVKAETGFELLVPSVVPQTVPPTPDQIRLLREKIDPDGEYLAPPQPAARKTK